MTLHTSLSQMHLNEIQELFVYLDQFYRRPLSTRNLLLLQVTTLSLDLPANGILDRVTLGSII